ncbi:uncharacterized protein LOC117580999 [Drosophila guanche]|uniref:Uncharacterized protein n=1 Tax=Drosophila guanche TaxID=7266 RepID=A0A3B0J902_DROGU|nr:uncharacterized protein LOC117580999 [Drosophila guanche]SPP78375.1 Hypothetical predicted protein [Drosophila guanche]
MNPFKCGDDTAAGSSLKEETNGGEGALENQKSNKLDQQSAKETPAPRVLKQSDFDGFVLKLTNHYKRVEEFKRRTEMTMKSYMKLMPLYNEAMRLYAAKLALSKQEKTEEQLGDAKQTLEALTEKTIERLRIIDQKLLALTDKIKEHAIEHAP